MPCVGCAARHTSGLEELGESLAEFASPQAVNRYAPDMLVAPTHMDIALDFAGLKAQELRVRVVTTFRCEGTADGADAAGALTRATVNGVSFDALAVEAVGAGGAVTHSYDGKLIELRWAAPFAAGEERRVAFNYNVRRPIAGMYFSDAPLYAITDHETERARHWLACVDYPAVRTTLSFELTVPAGMTALANGALAANSTDTVVRYALDYPCPSYLICVAAGEWMSVADEPVDGMPIRYFAPKGTPEGDVRRAFDKTPAMVRWLSGKLGVPFPWPKYYQIASPRIRGAMENISLVTWSDMFLMDATWAQERKFLTDLVNIHEMAHTYFGDMVVIRHFEHAWLKESWATYIESCWIEDHHGAADFQFEMVENADAYIAETQRYVRPIVTRRYDSSWGLFDSHTYPGGCWRLHMLRRFLGERTFWTAVTTYLQRFQRKTAETEDFRKVLEAQSGRNLLPFFDQWVYGRGFPKLKGTYKFDADQRVAVVTLEQTQVDAKAGIGAFDLSLEVLVVDTDGAEFRERIVLRAADGGNARASAIVRLGSAKPAIVAVDPRGDTLFQLDLDLGEELLASTARGAPGVATRVWAVRALAKAGSPSAVRKLQDVLLQEKHYGVRSKGAAALAKIHTRAAAAALAALLENEKDPMAQFAVAKACTLRDAALERALVTFLARSDLTYRARAAALESLALQLNPERIPELRRVASDPAQIGQHALVRCGALRALGADRSPESFDDLVRRALAHSEPERARGALMSAIAHSAAWQGPDRLRRAMDVLANEGLRDDNLWVRMAAVGGLVELHAVDYLGHILDCKKDMPEIDWPFVDRRCRALREAQGAIGPGAGVERVKALASSVQELEEKLRKLDERVGSLSDKVKVSEGAGGLSAGSSAGGLSVAGSSGSTAGGPSADGSSAANGK